MSEISLITIYQPIFPITHAGAKKIVAKVINMESGKSMLKEQAVFNKSLGKLQLEGTLVVLTFLRLFMTAK